jgi:hypothetical protein
MLRNMYSRKTSLSLILLTLLILSGCNKKMNIDYSYPQSLDDQKWKDVGKISNKEIYLYKN